MKKKDSGKSGEQAQHAAAMETEIFKDLMGLMEHCSYRKYDDGDPREPGWITIRTNGAAWVVQVVDLDTRLQFQVVAETLDKALETTQLYLSCEQAPWEPCSWLKRKDKK
jgi:hypothetical protein